MLSNLPFEEEIEDALFGVQIALDEASIDIAEKFNQKLEKMDEQMNVLDEIAEIGRELDVVESFLDSNLSFIQRDLDTIYRIQENLLKEKDLAFNIAELEEQSIRHQNSWKSLQFDAPKIQPIVEKGKNLYGLAENVLAVPMALVQLTDFEKTLANAQRFYEDCVGVPKIDFDKVFDMLEKTKDTLEAGCQTFTAEQVACLSPMASSFSNYSAVSSSGESLNSKSFVSSSNILEKAISRKSSNSGSSETSIDMPLANSINRCANSVTVSTPGCLSKSESNQSIVQENIRPARSCPNDVESLFKTALENTPSVEELLTAISPGPNTPSSTILI
uniref:Uncharacterized protein n=1 Tax=Panagrolaimus sp. JU765 TaxID=591449 RepID=A0AC34QW95_9BILA